MSSIRNKGEPHACDVLANLWQLVQSVLDESESDMGDLGLSPKTFFLLTEVEEHPSPADLARKMHLPPPTVTYMIKQLEEEGFLGRRAEPGDRRKFRLVQTEAGRDVLRQAQEALGTVFVERLRRLDRDDVLAFDRIVKRLAEGDGASRRS